MIAICYFVLMCLLEPIGYLYYTGFSYCRNLNHRSRFYQGFERFSPVHYFIDIYARLGYRVNLTTKWSRRRINHLEAFD